MLVVCVCLSVGGAAFCFVPTKHQSTALMYFLRYLPRLPIVDLSTIVSRISIIHCSTLFDSSTPRDIVYPKLPPIVVHDQTDDVAYDRHMAGELPLSLKGRYDEDRYTNNMAGSYEERRVVRIEGALHSHSAVSIITSVCKVAGEGESTIDRTNTHADYIMGHHFISDFGYRQSTPYTSHTGDAIVHSANIALSYSQLHDKMHLATVPVVTLQFYFGHAVAPGKRVPLKQSMLLSSSSLASSFPQLSVAHPGIVKKAPTMIGEVDAIANDAESPHRVRGGEWAVLNCGYIGLAAMLHPWQKQVNESFAQHVKREDERRECQPHTYQQLPFRRPHFIIVTDSCYAGLWIDELNKIESRIKHGNVTILASCGAKEQSRGGLFAPVFFALQHEKVRLQLFAEYDALSNESFARFNSSECGVTQTPIVYSTHSNVASMLSRDDVSSSTIATRYTVPVKMQGTTSDIHLLGVNVGFWRYAVRRLIIASYEDNMLQHDVTRASLTKEEAALIVNQCSTSRPWTVVDYKLRTDKHKRPLGLFLIDTMPQQSVAEMMKSSAYHSSSSSVRSHRLCAHVHFSFGNSFSVTCINLVRHIEFPAGSGIFDDEDISNLSAAEVKANKHKIELSGVPRPWQWENHAYSSLAIKSCYRPLLEEALRMVEMTEPGRWQNTASWQDDYDAKSYFNLFRTRERRG